jgi:hypothetical protein
MHLSVLQNSSIIVLRINFSPTLLKHRITYISKFQDWSCKLVEKQTMGSWRLRKWRNSLHLQSFFNWFRVLINLGEVFMLIFNHMASLVILVPQRTLQLFSGHFASLSLWPLNVILRLLC